LDVSLARRPVCPRKQAPITALQNGADENRLDDWEIESTIFDSHNHESADVIHSRTTGSGELLRVKMPPLLFF
jgi:hypothetical protein